MFTITLTDLLSNLTTPSVKSGVTSALVLEKKRQSLNYALGNTPTHMSLAPDLFERVWSILAAKGGAHAHADAIYVGYELLVEELQKLYVS